jgi:aminotransferase
MSAMLGLVDPGNEVIVFEPYYENYGPDTILAGAAPRFVRLNPPDWSFDPDQLAAAFNNNTRAIIINTPNNPTGKVFSLQELQFIADLCVRWNVTAITDEIYEHMVYSGKHHRMADIDGMAERTVTISGASKTFSATGWRVGWLIAPPAATDAIRKVHDFLTVGAAAPLQEGVAHALGFPDEYYHDLEAKYRVKRDALLATLRGVGFTARTPEGAYYILTDAKELIEAAERTHGVSFNVANRPRDSAFAHWMVKEIGVATVPGSSFYRDPQQGASQIRFCYCKKPETLELAERLLLKLKG